MSEQCECPPAAGAATCSLKPAGARALCPTNGKPGSPVDTLTLKSMLALPLTALSSPEYLYCRDPACPTVYFSADGSQVFTEGDLRERVYHKHPDEDDVPVCYCFRHTAGAVRAEVRARGESSAPQVITAGIQAGACACEIRNPQGSCCLGDVGRLIKHTQAMRS